MDTPTKRCSRCGVTKPLGAFNRRSDRKSGYTSKCKECNRAACRDYGRRNQESLKQKRYEKYHANPEHNRAIKNKSYAKHAEANSIRNREKYWANPEKARAKARNWQKLHWPQIKLRIDPTKTKEYAHKHYIANKAKYRVRDRNRRALEYAAGGVYTLADIRAMHKSQHGQCYYCGCKLTKYHVDHVVPLTRGGSNDPSNLVLACPPCNLRKSDKLPHEWPEGGRLL